MSDEIETPRVILIKKATGGAASPSPCCSLPVAVHGEQGQRDIDAHTVECCSASVTRTGSSGCCGPSPVTVSTHTRSCCG